MSGARIIDGKQVASRVRTQVKADVERYVAEHGEPPGLAVVLVGDDEASRVYVSGKQKACAEAGIRSFGHELPAATSAEDLSSLITELNAAPEVDGILIQIPLPEHLDAAAMTALIDPSKDVDGLTPTNAGLLAQGNPALVSATPAGVIELLKESGTPLEGAEAVVVGRSELVGRPLAFLLLGENATVTLCHSRTRDLPGTCRRADILVAATGQARLIGRDMVKPGATVIDVGITRTPDGLVGDVDFEAVSEVAGAITPVPGGVGPMTIAMLLRNTLKAAEGRRNRDNERPRSPLSGRSGRIGT